MTQNLPAPRVLRQKLEDIDRSWMVVSDSAKPTLGEHQRILVQMRA
ncbi:MAG: hypothetical protein F6J90_28535 [Moorea sp. SIOASIH]|nr:hypothetical protein [Moorena sp. SIOASIH]